MKQHSTLTLGEIYLQDESFAAINGTLPEIYRVIDEVFVQHWDELIFTGCGSSYYLAQTAAFAFSSYTGIPAKSVPCSELYFFPEAFVGKGRKILVLPITRKSYTTEVVMAVTRMRSFDGVKSLSITCDPDSSKYNDYMIISPRAAEDSVVMTRSFTGMVYLTVILALRVAGRLQELEKLTEGYAEMAAALLLVMDSLSRRIVSENPDLSLFVVLGQGVNYGIANECMNKMKEMGLASSEAYHSLEYRHGPMSLVDCNTLIIMLGNDASIQYDVQLMEQMKGLGAVTLAIGENASLNFPFCQYILNLDYRRNSLEYSAVIGFIGQFMGLYIAERKGLDADHPRHLSQAIVIGKRSGMA